MAVTYFVSFDEIMKIGRKIDEIGYRGLYWEDDSKFVVEIPVVSNKGAFMGVIYRCEIHKGNIESFVKERLPSVPEGISYAKVFEISFLNVFKKVLGKLGERSSGELRFLEEPEVRQMKEDIAHVS